MGACNYIDEQYDITGRFKACVARASPAHAIKDARTAALVGDKRFFLLSTQGASEALKAPGFVKCQPSLNGIIEKKVNSPLDDSKDYSNEDAAESCAIATNDYKAVYNREIVKLIPSSYYYNCPKSLNPDR